MKQKKLTPCQEFCKNLYGYSLMLWDGLGFFGTDHMKLGRLRGEPVNFCTMFTSPRTLILSLLGLGIGIYIVITEAERLNLPMAQTISLIED